MEMIKHSHNGFVVYETPYILPNQEEVKRGLFDLVNVFRPGEKTRLDAIKRLEEASNGKSNVNPGPGVQCDLRWSNNPYVSSVQNLLSNQVLQFHNYYFDRKGVESFGAFWTYISHPENLDSNYHTHELFYPAENHIVTTWTITYYLDVPDNCEGDDGKLLFSHDSNDDNALKIFPKKETIYIFSGTLSHKPLLAPKSTQARVVLAGNVYIPFIDKVLL